MDSLPPSRGRIMVAVSTKQGSRVRTEGAQGATTTRRVEYGEQRRSLIHSDSANNEIVSKAHK